MPQFRQYPQATSVLPTDAFVLDRAGTGTLYALAASIANGLGWFTPQQFGALANASWNGSAWVGTDDTAAIQAAINAAGVAGTVYMPNGAYLVSATLEGLINQCIAGAGPNQTQIVRNFTSGDTLRFANIGAGTVEGIWFRHANLPSSGDTSLVNRVSDGSAHISIVSGQGFSIRDCWLWRMPYQIRVESSSVFKIDSCSAQGVWDPETVAMQEGIAAISIGLASYCQIGKITRSYFAGSGSAARSTTWTASDGTVTATVVNNIGDQYGVLIGQCEDLLVTESYFGGHSVNNIAAVLGSGAVALEWRFTANFFDGAGLASGMIEIQATHDGTCLNGLVIGGNHFNGEELSFQAISFINASGGGVQPAVTNFSIEGNTSQATVGSFCTLYNARGGVITGNTITSYNCRNVSPGADVTFCAAVWGSQNTTAVLCDGNTVGGSVNADAAPSFCYQGITGSGIAETDTLWNGVGASGNQVGIRRGEPVYPVNANYRLTGYEDTIFVTNTTTASGILAPTVNPPDGYRFVLKDMAGTFATHSCQLFLTVDGAVNPIYNTNYFYGAFEFNGTAWSRVG